MSSWEFKTIPLGEAVQTLKPPEKYVREKVDNELIQELAESIEKIGLKCPIIVDRDYTIIDGVHRYEALRRIGRKDLQVPIIVLRDVSYSEEPERAIWLAYLVNRYRTGGADEQFNKQLLKETIAKLVLLTLKKLDEDKRREIVREIEHGIIPRILVQEIQKTTGTSYRTARRWVESLLEPSKEEFISWLKAELNISISLGAPDGAVHQEKLKESEEKLKEVVSKSPDPSKAEYIIRIREKIPDIDVEKLNKLSKRMLQVLARKVESGQIDEVRRLLSEGDGSNSGAAGGTTDGTVNNVSSVPRDQPANHDGTNHDTNSSNGTTSKEDSDNMERDDNNTRIKVEESQSNVATVAVVVEESREKPERESNEDAREETENVREEQSQRSESKSEVKPMVESRSESSSRTDEPTNDSNVESEENDARVNISKINVEYVIDVLRLFRDLFKSMEKELCNKCRDKIRKKWQVLFNNFEWIPDRPVRTPHDLAEDAIEALLVELRKTEECS